MKLLHGGGDVVSEIELALERAKAGDVCGVVIVEIRPDKTQWWHGAYIDDTEFAWARLMSAVESARHELVTQGLEDWK